MSIMMNSSFTHSLKIIISKRKKVVNKKIKIFLGAINIECVCARVHVCASGCASGCARGCGCVRARGSSKIRTLGAPGGKGR